MVSGWVITLALINAYILLLVWLARSGRMERWNLSLMLGFVLMIRTGRGRNFLEWVSKPRRLWNAFGDLGVVVSLLGMLAMTVLMLSIVPTVLNPASGVQPLAANEILVIPGVNPFVPLWYGLIALIVTLVVHEGGHGVLSLANKMRVKSLGLLIAVVPIGAFVEPDEEDLQKSPRRSRLRVYAAGPAVNFAVGFIVLGAMMGAAAAMEPLEGAPIWQVSEDGAAEQAGMQPNTLLVEADGAPLASWNDFIGTVQGRSPGDQIELVDDEGVAYNVTLGNRWDAYSDNAQQAILSETPQGNATCDAVFGPDENRTGATCATMMQQAPLVGVSAFAVNEYKAVLAQPFDSGGNFLTLTFLPIGEVRGTPVMSSMPEFYATPFDADIYWPLVNLLFWVFWVNLMVGLTNILPMLPLDGGHLFRDSFAGLVQKIRPKMEQARQDRLVGRVAGILSLVIFVAFLLQIFGPRIVQAFN